MSQFIHIKREAGKKSKIRRGLKGNKVEKYFVKQYVWNKTTLKLRARNFLSYLSLLLLKHPLKNNHQIVWYSQQNDSIQVSPKYLMP